MAKQSGHAKHILDWRRSMGTESDRSNPFAPVSGGGGDEDIHLEPVRGERNGR